MLPERKVAKFVVKDFCVESTTTHNVIVIVRASTERRLTQTNIRILKSFHNNYVDSSNYPVITYHTKWIVCSDIILMTLQGLMNNPDRTENCQ